MWDDTLLFIILLVSTNRLANLRIKLGRPVVLNIALFFFRKSHVYPLHHSILLKSVCHCELPLNTFLLIKSKKLAFCILFTIIYP